MKPLSIKIDTSLPTRVQEGWVKAFQEHCFSKGVGWGLDDAKEFRCLKTLLFCIQNKKTISLFTGTPIGNSEPFTLSTQKDFEAFTAYLDKYIAHYSKPEPMKTIDIRIEHDTDLYWIAESLSNGEWEIVEGEGGKYSGYTNLNDLVKDINNDKTIKVGNISIHPKNEDSKPEPQYGQLWYTKKGKVVEIGDKSGDNHVMVKHLQTQHHDKFHSFPLACLDRILTDEECREFEKPEPKVGEYWVHEGDVYLITERHEGWKMEKDGICCLNIEGRKCEVFGKGFDRYATPEEITQYRNTQKLLEAEKKYPAGTRFRSIWNDKYIGISSGELGINRSGEVFCVTEDDKSVTVYGEERWAEVIPEKEEKQEFEVIQPETEYKIPNATFNNGDQIPADLQSERIKELEEELTKYKNLVDEMLNRNPDKVAKLKQMKKDIDKLLNQQ